MRRLFSILSFVLLYATITFGQAAVEIPFTVANNGPNSQELVFGLDPTATSGIDPALGEVEQPPLPPSGVFDARFVSRAGQSQLGEGTLKDIRNAPAFPYSGTYEHQIYFQTGSAGTEITISWNLPPEIVAGSVIQDLFGGVLGYDEPFVGIGSITVTNPTLVTGLQIIVVYDDIGPVIPEPVFGIDPTFYNFPSVFVGSFEEITATISNTGDAELTVAQPTPVGDFSVIGTFPISIPEGGAPVDVTIRFAPTTEGFQEGDLEFVHNAAGSPFQFHVTGTGAGTAPIFRVVPTSLDFGEVTPLTSEDLTVNVYNDGLVDPLIISLASIAAPEFDVAPTSATIAAGDFEVFTVTFTPPAVGVYTGTLVFDHNAAGTPGEVSLTGEGYIPPAVYGLVFEEIEVDRYENDSYTNTMDLLDIDGPLHALQFRLLTNLETEDDILLTYQSIAKNHTAISGDNWILETNVVRGPINANGASQDTIFVLLYNIDDEGDLTEVNYYDLFKVTYKVAKLPNLVTEGKSTFRIFKAEGSTFEGFPVDIESSREIFTVNVLAAGGGYGDVNGDGCVDILDLIMVVDHIVGRDSLSRDPGPNGTSEFDRANIAPWYDLDPLPTPDLVVNVQDLSLIQNIILTEMYPNGEPLAPCGGPLPKFNGQADATVNIYINTDGISAYLDSKIGIRGAQIEFGSIVDPTDNMVINTPLGQGYYLRADDFLRTLMYDRLAQNYIEDGVNHFMADMPFAITNVEDISLNKLILVDINQRKVMNIEVNLIYANPSLPYDYILWQNYPNPFNPNTTVKFQVPKTSDVTVKIYDMLGQEVRTLFAGQVMRGTYTVDWDGFNDAGVQMSTGTYIYRMIAGEFVQSKKMVLLK